MKRLAALAGLVALATAALLAGCSPPTVGQLAVHRLDDGSLNAVIVGCEPGLQQVTAYVGEVSDAAQVAADWRLTVDPHNRADSLVEWPLVGDAGTDVVVARPLVRIPEREDISLLALTADRQAIANSVSLTPEAVQRLQPGSYAFHGLNGEVRYTDRKDLLAAACP